MKSPFKFLDAYTLQDKEVFFGRDEEVERLFQMVDENRLILVYGQSGTGKTSLVQCGLASRFDPTDWFPLFIRREENINQVLDRGLAQSLSGENMEKHVESIEEIYMNYLRPVYLIFDQLEELFILGTPEEQGQFIRSVSDILQAKLACRVIFVLREEYLGHLYGFERVIPSLFDRRLRVEPMSRANVDKVIIHSCNKFDIHLENPEENTQLIIDTLSAGKSGIQLPYLQVYLDQLYREAATQSANGIRFDHSLIQQFSSIDDVLGEFLDKQTLNIQQVLEKEYSIVPSTAVTKVLNAFVTLDGTKRPLKRTELKVGLLSIPQTDFVLSQLEKSRLLRMDNDHYELAHDTLAQKIAGQRSQDEIAYLQMARIVKDRFLAYDTTRTLLNNNELQLIKSYKDILQEEKLLNTEEWSFVNKSARVNRRRRMLLAVTILSIITALTLMVIYSDAKRRLAEEKEQDAVEQEQIANQLLVDIQSAQKKEKKANYDKLLSDGIARMAVSDFTGAIAAFETALTFDSLRQEAYDHIEEAKKKLGVSNRFEQLIIEGDNFYNQNDDRLYIDALRKYEAALGLNFNNGLAQSKVDATRGKLAIAFEKLKYNGHIFLEVNNEHGFKEAIKTYEQAARIRPGDTFIQNQIRKAKGKLEELKSKK